MNTKIVFTHKNPNGLKVTLIARERDISDIHCNIVGALKYKEGLAFNDTIVPYNILKNSVIALSEI